MSIERLCHSSAIKQKYLKVEMHRNREVGYKFNGSEIDISDWSDDYNFIFSCRATIKPFKWPRKGRG